MGGKVSITSTPSVLADLRRPAPRFQRAINLKYDLGNADTIAAYVPTAKTADALKRLLKALALDARQRAFLLHGPYGSGKSLLVTTLAAMFSRDAALTDALNPVVSQLEDIDLDAAELTRQHLSDGPRLLPVVLNGDEGDLAYALFRALFSALRRIGWDEIRLTTHYRAAVETLNLWQQAYPETYTRLKGALAAEGWTLEALVEGLNRAEAQAYDVFQRLYPTLTAGATFNHYGQSVVDTYREASTLLRREARYDGIVILWDEFGRFLESRAGDVFGREAALLQELAEFANHSAETQVHLILVTHKVIGGYVWNLPLDYLQEWQRIGERFQTLDVSGDPLVAYRLIAAALTTPNEAAWSRYLEAHRTTLAQMAAGAVEQRLFPELGEVQLQRWVMEGAHPLHPLTVYCLPRLSNKVAQNERTLFTFLTADEPAALSDLLSRARLNGAVSWIGPELLYDYFAVALRADTGPGGAHGVWAAAEHALSKIPSEDVLSRRLIKALAVLQAVGETDVLHPTTGTLAFALQVDFEQVEQAAHTLARRKLARLHRLDRTWELVVGSDVDIEAAIQEALNQRPPSPLQLRRLLEQTLPPRLYQARQHNARAGMARFFRSWYRYPEEITGSRWDTVLKDLDYADGLVVYLLARNPSELAQARALAQAATSNRVVFVVPPKPLLIEEPLQELIALLDLKNSPVFREQDHRIAGELEFFIEDVTARLARLLAPLVDPWEGGAEWYWQGQRQSTAMNTVGQVTRLLSEICDVVFPHTAEFHNDALNRRNPTTQQIKASEQVIDVLLTQDPSEQLGITGFGPEWLIVHTILRVPGILRQDEHGDWLIGSPTQAALAEAWQVIEEFLERARREPQPFADLLDKLQAPPFGLRVGVLPLLVAAALRRHWAVVTARRDRKPVLPVNGATFTDLCRNSQHYTLELGPDDERHRQLWAALESRFCATLSPEERRRQPLQVLSVGMMRWLQSLPRFAQTTQRLSEDVLQFRQLIESAAKDPAPVLFDQLPILLEQGSPVTEPGKAYREAIAARLDQLCGELETAYLDLLRRGERFVIEHFAADAMPSPTNGLAALTYWVRSLEAQAQMPLSGLRLGSVQAQALMEMALASPSPDTLLDVLARRIAGAAPRDWTDSGEERFYHILAEAKATAERQVAGLASAAEKILEVNVQVGERVSQPYRFRQVTLSDAGQRILQNFKSTLQTTGRILSADEKRQLAVLLLEYVLGDEDV